MEQNRELRNKHIYDRLIFDKEGKNIQGKKTVPSARSVGKVEKPHINR